MNKAPDSDHDPKGLGDARQPASIKPNGAARNSIRPDIDAPDDGLDAMPDSVEPVQDLLRAQLAESGLNLYACLDLHQVQQSEITGVPMKVDAPGQASLLMVGNSGSAFWDACQRSPYRDDENPVDAFATASVLAALSHYAPQRVVRLLYPAADCTIPLQRLGELAGWHQPSPLGTGIDPEWGLWFAYRALVLVDSDWIATRPRVQSTNVCAECSGQDCLSACPAAALSMETAPDLRACAQYRVTGHSSVTAVSGDDPAKPGTTSLCAETCLARCACPVAPDQRYAQDQLNHHYSRALVALRDWIDPKPV